MNHAELERLEEGFQVREMAVLMLRFMVTVVAKAIHDMLKLGSAAKLWWTARTGRAKVLQQICFGLEHNEAKRGMEKRTEHGY